MTVGERILFTSYDGSSSFPYCGILFPKKSEAVQTCWVLSYEIAKDWSPFASDCSWTHASHWATDEINQCWADHLHQPACFPVGCSPPEVGVVSLRPEPILVEGLNGVNTLLDGDLWPQPLVHPPPPISSQQLGQDRSHSRGPAPGSAPIWPGSPPAWPSSAPMWPTSAALLGSPTSSSASSSPWRLFAQL